MKKILLTCVIFLMSLSSVFAVFPLVPVAIGVGIAAATSAASATGTAALVDNEVIESDDLNFMGGLAVSHVPETHILAGTVGDTAKETNRTFLVGEEFDLYIGLRVVNRHFYNRSKPITVTITIPHTKTAYYKDAAENGVTLIGKEQDDIKSLTTYTFSIMSGKAKDLKSSTIRFRCAPLEAGENEITISFDQNVKSQYDVRDTFHFY